MATETSGFQEPESKANPDAQPEYPYNNIIQTESGHTFEMDDTPTRERVRIQHGKSENFIEMHPNGDQVYKVFGNSYMIIIKNNNILVKGQCNITVEGSAVFDIQGDKIERIQGNFQQIVEGNYEVLVKKETKIMSGKDMSIMANPLLDGRLFLDGGEINVYSDLLVDGEVAAQKVSAMTRMDAGLGISAGPFGFVTLLGGFSAGYPLAVPFCVMALGLVSSATVVTAPLGGFGVMASFLMTDIVNTQLHNAHFHFGPKGPTGRPIPPMI